MKERELVSHLFRTEYRKIVSVLYQLFGIGHIEIAEDIVSDTFLLATELWGLKGVPENPTAWLYAVAKNKTRNYLKHHSLFTQKISDEIKHAATTIEEMGIDLSDKNINDSQLAMIFTICNPGVSPEAQIALALNLLCGFGIQEMADAFLTNKEVIYKRLNRAKEKLKVDNIKIEQPTLKEIDDRLGNVLTTLYLLFSEGYYSACKNVVLQKDLCLEAMRLTQLLLENEHTNRSAVNALFALMCFHSSRFEARTDRNGEIILYEEQDETLWNNELIEIGNHFFIQASKGKQLTKYHLEAAIAYWHTQKQDTHEKWENILQLYNKLVQLEYSPIAALNRTYALAKANGKREAIVEAEKINLTESHLYYYLLGNLYFCIDNKKALKHFQSAIDLAKSSTIKKAISKNINRLKMKVENKRWKKVRDVYQECVV